jgi:hypothetical protein
VDGVVAIKFAYADRDIVIAGTHGRWLCRINPTCAPACTPEQNNKRQQKCNCDFATYKHRIRLSSHDSLHCIKSILFSSRFFFKILTIALNAILSKSFLLSQALLSKI